MQGLFKIFRRYIVTAYFITCLILFLNMIAYASFILHYSQYSSHTNEIRQMSKELTSDSHSITLSETGLNMLKSKYAWAMLLDDAGNVIWNWNLPIDIPRSFTASNIASFSKWYLNDYPVNVWTNDNGLLVVGSPKNSRWKMRIELPEILIEDFPYYLFIVIAVNFLLILLLSVYFAYRFYRSLFPIAKGIDQLSEQERITLPEKGMAAELAKKLNKTSSILETQSTYLSKRDTARTNWIDSVSHDIRTPLSMIMGYADSLESDTSLNDNQRQQVYIIKNQSIMIKKLLEDLNLTSKLEYNMQPLRMTAYSPASLLREILAAYINDNLDEKYSISLEIKPAVETLTLQGDTDLLARAYNNIIGNSIRHNEKGCNITVTASFSDNVCTICFSDNGRGIPSKVIAALASDIKHIENEPHIMGLRIVSQIVNAHNGIFEIHNGNKGTEVMLKFCL